MEGRKEKNMERLQIENSSEKEFEDFDEFVESLKRKKKLKEEERNREIEEEETIKRIITIVIQAIKIYIKTYFKEGINQSVENEKLEMSQSRLKLFGSEVKPDYNKGFHRANCFIDLLSVEAIDWYERLLIVYSLINEVNGKRLKKEIKDHFLLTIKSNMVNLSSTDSGNLNQEEILKKESSDASYEEMLDFINQMLEKKYPSTILETLQKMLLTQIHERSYMGHYKTHRYSAAKEAINEDESNIHYWHKYMLELRKFVEDQANIKSTKTSFSDWLGCTLI